MQALDEGVSEAEFRLIGDATHALGFSKVGTESRIPPYDDLLYRHRDHDRSPSISLRLTYHLASEERRPQIWWRMETERTWITEELWSIWSELQIAVPRILAEESVVKRDGENQIKETRD